MDPIMLLMRTVHVVAGVYWAGAIFYFVTLLGPSIRDAGPEGGKVMQALIRRRQLEILPVVAVLTVISGLWLLWKVSGGFQRAWFAAPIAHTLSLGMVTSIVALIVGLSVMRPAALKVGPAMQAAMQAPEGPERDARLAEARAIQARVGGAGKVVAALLLVAVVTMAVARFV
jgi:hypothetical protein